MNEFNSEIRPISATDKKLVADFIKEHWGSSFSVSRGKIYHIVDLPGFICKQNGKIAGLITYHIVKKDCEIVTLNSDIENEGLGTQLLNKVINVAKRNQCKRVWLVTTNDNVNAIRFYQKRGFDWVGFYRDAMIESRKLKSEIPWYGNDGIPIRHEIEFEHRLHY
ncbi:MAG: GNAT family N-acetyltransferase [Calditrichaceae bacterium]|nr:GNAT family N-acetyltransferase [Calditrichaceae bacterium]